jgi:hypothetical protein
MSELGKNLINVIKEAKKKGLVALQTSLDVGKMLKLSQREFSEMIVRCLLAHETLESAEM